MTEHYVGIDIHKTESQVAVLDELGEPVEEVRVKNANLDEIAEKYAGSKAAIEAGSNYFTIYDRLDEHLDVTLANPAKADWLKNQKQKDDRKDAKNLARFLRMNEIPESYVPPTNFRKYRQLARGRKKFMDKRTDFKNEVHALLDQNGVTHSGSLWSDEGRKKPTDIDLRRVIPVGNSTHNLSRLDKEIASPFNRRSTEKSVAVSALLKMWYGSTIIASRRVS